MSERLVDSSVMTVHSELGRLDALFGIAPEITAMHSRVMVGRWFAKHYQAWRFSLSSRLKRMERRGAFRFYLDPGPKARTDAQIREAVSADPRLERVGGKGVVRSDAALLLERGGTVRPKRSRYLAVPAGKFQRMNADKRRSLIGDGPADYNARNPNARAFVLVRKRGGSPVPLLVRDTGQRLASGKPKLEVLFSLRRSVQVSPQLGVLAAWQRLEGYRQQTLSEATSRIVRDMSESVVGRGAFGRRSA